MTISPLIGSWRRSGETIVFTNGCFDIIHAGHVHYLKGARSLGDKLIVGVNSDASVKRLKGIQRPFNRLSDRLKVLQAIQYVDLTIAFEDDTPLQLIEMIEPNVLVKGGDYQIHNIVGSNFVIAYGGIVKTISFVKGNSTTELINRIKGL
ncbi:MAG: D-glycero-beta-D-manno-heptose 1-phosphate adenylyltransferase [Bacteroidetes bacterium]|nr:D-glycero-beta-D-manno-heptose 1-phosphate adenylyltransferase [Bacteroidota bacterium]MDA1122421.1 D-glycero-beta-D-manno-heptose 1-phosphate adenylyltransferase [Bacteroidota bacterium]